MSLRILRKRLQYWINHRQRARDLADELETHRGYREADLERSGLSAADAAAASRRALGNLALATEDVRDVCSPGLGVQVAVC